MHILVIEISTTSAKALVYNYDTDCESSSSICVIETELLSNVFNDTTLHDPQSATNQALLLAKNICSGYSIDLISIVSTWHSLVICDKFNTPVSPVYLWSNQIAENDCAQLKKNAEFTSAYYEKTGCIISSTYPFFKLLSLRYPNSVAKQLQSELHLYTDIDKDLATPTDTNNPFDGQLILDQGSFLMHQLTGHNVILNSMASGSGLYNLENRDYDDQLLSLIGIQRQQLPRVVTSCETFPLTHCAADALGLHEGIPVIAPGPDGAFNQLGADALSEGVMTLSVGTSGALRLFTKQPFLSEDKSTWCYVLEEGWLVGAATSGACNCVDYMKNQLFEVSMTYDHIEKELSHISIDEQSPLFMPFIFGERCPGWNNQRKSGLVYQNMCESKDQDTRDISAKEDSLLSYYATLEGVLFNLYQCYLDVIKLTGKPHVIKLSGGILHSPYWTQLCADIFGVSIQLDEQKQTSLMGGVFLAKKIQVSERTHLTQLSENKVTSVHPSMERHLFYQSRFRQYLEIYHSEPC